MIKNIKFKIFLILEKIKIITLATGLVSIICGIMFMGWIYGVSPKRDLSLFNNIADTRVLSDVGGVFLVVGILLILISRIIAKINA